MDNPKIEVGMPLDKNLIYYHNMLIERGLFMSFACSTHDVYYTNKPFEDFDGLSENQMKRSCIRLRFVQSINKPASDFSKLKKQEQQLIKQGYKKIFDTIKLDFHYRTETMDKVDNYIQLQDIKDVGLLVYFCNPDYYKYPFLEQRKKILEELNSYGFTFKEGDLGLDKLRTLYYKKPCYSLNQDA